MTCIFLWIFAKFLIILKGYIIFGQNVALFLFASIDSWAYYFICVWYGLPSLGLANAN